MSRHSSYALPVVPVEGDHHVQEDDVVQGGDVGEPLVDRQVEQSVGELRGLHGRLHDPVRAVGGPGLGGKRGAARERDVRHGRAP
ncbi:hypothetical protein [Streptomyces galilaeus]|uniref:hypothetical protein n=1 Tax=Streptomyces galilaeus TaxID=33899 RepID=UPI0038F618A0